VVDPLKFVGPSLAAPFLVPAEVAEELFAEDDEAWLVLLPFAALVPLASTKSETLFPPSMSASCALKA
jgi:hypothetical protein